MILFRKAILLIHGFAGGNYDYNSLGNDLQLYRDFDVYTFTLPGHDKTIINHVKSDDWINAAEKQIEILIKRGYKTIYVVGHSMGGVIAAHIANKYPQVKKLVLASPAFRYFTFKDDKLDVIKSLEQTPSLFKDYKPEDVISRILKIPFATTMEFMKLVKEHANDIKGVSCPTLVLWGNKDKIVPRDSAMYVYKNIKSTSVTLYEINDVTHDTFRNSRYDEVYNIIYKFLREHNLPKKEIKKI